MRNFAPQTGVKMSIKRRISSLLFPKPYRTLELINWNARFRQWERENANAPLFSTREDLYSHTHAALRDSPIEFLEFGVYKGDSLRYWASLTSHADSHFFGFDTFTGLPEDWIDMKVGTFDTGGIPPQIVDPRITFIKGLFQETLADFSASFSPRGQLVVHIDSDLYTSALYVLTAMNRFLLPGAIVIFDEFGSFMDEFRAWSDYCSAYYRSATLIGRVGSIQAAFRMD